MYRKMDKRTSERLVKLASRVLKAKGEGVKPADVVRLAGCVLSQFVPKKPAKR